MININFKKFTRKQTCLFGVMLGDIMGVPHEFKSRIQIDADFIKSPISMTKEYSSYNVPLGIYSDDFSQTLCVEECIDNPNLEFNDEMLIWANGKYWVDNHLFDIGNQTAESLSYYEDNARIMQTPDMACGNGGGMRLAPVAFIDCDDNDYNMFVSHVNKYNELTHNNELCKNAALFYVTLLALLKTNQEHSFDMLWERAGQLTNWVPPKSNHHKLGSGYVIDTLNSIEHCIECSTNFHQAITKAIKLGGDTDTTACYVGAVAALYFGLDSMTDEWMKFIQPSLTNIYVRKLFGDCYV